MKHKPPAPEAADGEMLPEYDECLPLSRRLWPPFQRGRNDRNNLRDALDRLAGMNAAEAGQVTLKVALLGRQGLKINDPDPRDRLNSLEGDFSGRHLLCLMHAGIRRLDPQADTGTGLDQAYAMAVGRRGGA